MLSHLLVAALALGAPRPTKLAMAELETGPGVDAPLAHLVTTLVVAEVRKQPGLTITSQDEIKALLGLERQKRLLECAEVSCLAEVGGALGVDQMVTGSVARLGESLLMVLRVVDVRRARVLREVTRRVRNAEPDAIVDILPGAVAELFSEGELAPAPLPVPLPAPALIAPPLTQTTVAVQPARSNAPWWVVGGGALVAAVGVTLLAYDLSTRGSSGGATTYGVPYSTAQPLQVATWTAVAVGAAGVVGGLAWGLFRPAPPAGVAP